MKKYKKFFKGKTVLVTGHTGFKGSWLCLILWLLGARVIGISSYDLGKESNYSILKINKKIYKEYKFNILNLHKLKNVIFKSKPDIIFHLAAQSLVSKSVKNPIETFNTNIIGTANILETIRDLKKKCSAVIITSDKCYLNKETNIGYKETDNLGGIDPYSASKASAEIIFNSYFKSYFEGNKNISIATARAGNVIGGGDFSQDRIIPDVIRSISKNKILNIRSPKSTRPWQHVLEPLRGYLDLSTNLYLSKKNSGQSFNFGPGKKENYNVIEIIDFVKKKVPSLKVKLVKKKYVFKESGLLKLNCKKAEQLLGWHTFFNTKECINYTLDWYLCYLSKDNIEILTLKQIREYFEKNKF